MGEAFQKEKQTHESSTTTDGAHKKEWVAGWCKNREKIRSPEGKLAFGRWVLRIDTVRAQMNDTAILSSHEFITDV